MNKYDVYREHLQKDIDNIMEHKATDIKSLEYLKCLMEMTSELRHRSQIYNEMVKKGEIKSVEEHQHDIEEKQWKDKVPDSLVDERMYGMIEHFRMYKEYKTMYKKSKNEHDKQLMLEELKHMIEQHQLIVEEIMSCGLDCQEEKIFIKEFLQKTYRKVS